MITTIFFVLSGLKQVSILTMSSGVLHCTICKHTDTSHLGPNTLAALHRKELYIPPKFLTKMTHLGEGDYTTKHALTYRPH